MPRKKNRGSKLHVKIIRVPAVRREEIISTIVRPKKGSNIHHLTHQSQEDNSRQRPAGGCAGVHIPSCDEDVVNEAWQMICHTRSVLCGTSPKQLVACSKKARKFATGEVSEDV